MFIKKKAYKRQKDKKQWEEEGIELGRKDETNEGGEVSERHTEDLEKGDNLAREEES